MEAIIFFLLLSIFILFPNLITVYGYGIKIDSILEKPTSNVIDAIYQFGDSISDTGNAMRESPATCSCAFKPYGMTLLGPPTGRCSDGHLIIDFIAQALKVPYLDKDGDFRHGVNFAVAGATSLNVSTLAGKGVLGTATNSSILLQLGWFKSHLNTICTSTSSIECKQKLGKALFVVGEIGGNDYNMGGEQGMSMEDLHALVPEVIQSIVNVVKELIDVGAKRILVPGNFASGCMTIILVEFEVNDTTEYDELNCLRSWNELAMFHNDQLQNAIKDLRMEHRDVAIVYGDYYTPLTSIFKHARSLGFEEDGIHKACCGIADNEYNFGTNKMCGTDKVQVCQNPDKSVSWDGIHLTQHAYRVIADSLLRYTLPILLNHTFFIAL